MRLKRSANWASGKALASLCHCDGKTAAVAPAVVHGDQARFAHFFAPHIDQGEAGNGEISPATWFGLFAPAGTPKSIIARLASEVAHIVEERDFRRRMFVDRAVEPADAKLAATLQQHVDMRDTLLSHGTGTKADYLSALQELQRAEATLVADRGQRGEAEAALDTLRSEKAKALGQFRSDSANKYEEASDKAVVDGEAVEKARARLQRTVPSVVCVCVWRVVCACVVCVHVRACMRA